MPGFWGPLGDFFFAILKFLHENLSISWSWAIVVLTVIVRIVLIPLTWKQIKSMRAMQALQPHVKALQEKYRNDREVLNQKLMEFYRENKVSPFGSCLPMVFQIPVFIGLFFMLRYHGQVNGYIDAGAFASVWHSHSVSWLWIGDITKFNLGLMFLYIASQFGASWQTARRSAGQQRIIAFVIPVVFGIMMYFWKWPAGLMIYWFTSNVWAIAQQFVAEKIAPVPVPVVATLEKDKAARVRAGGKASVGPGGKASAGPRGKNSTEANLKSSTQPGGQTPTGTAGRSGGKSGAKRKGQKR